jgi:glycosyltransferase involved in cell wall biosynthesis
MSDASAFTTAAHCLPLSIVAPVYNEEAVVDQLVSEVVAAMSQRTAPWELIVVNDGSRDGTLEKLVAWHHRDPRIRVIDLSRNFGHQRALLAGLTQASGAVVACVDGDLQDPPGLLVEMIAALDANDVDVVYGVRRRRKEGVCKTTAYWLAYRLLRGILDVDLPLDAGDFAVMRRPVLEAMLRMPEQSLFLRGLRAWVGFRQQPFEYERAARSAGVAKYRWRDLFRLAYDGIFSFTHLPIRILGAIGFGAIGFSVAYSLYLVSAALLGIQTPRGFTTLIVAIMFFSGVQLVAIRILGAYIRRIHDEVRGRPLFLVRQSWGHGMSVERNRKAD